MARADTANVNYRYLMLERDPSDYEDGSPGNVLSAIYTNGAVLLGVNVPGMSGIVFIPLTDKQVDDLIEARTQLLEQVWGSLHGNALAA